MNGWMDKWMDEFMCVYMDACMYGQIKTFGGVFEDVALLLWSHHSKQGQYMHPGTATAHAVAIIV